MLLATRRSVNPHVDNSWALRTVTIVVVNARVRAPWRLSEMSLLKGRVAIVTGAGAGIGRAEALALSAHGAAVVVNDLRGDGSAEQVSEEIRAAGGRVIAHEADVADWATGEVLVALALETFGRLDVVIANAGIVRRSPLVAVTEEDVDSQVGVLYKGSFGLLRHAAHWWSTHEEDTDGHRTFLATSSSAGVPGGVEEFSVYGSLKAGIAALTTTAALELAPHGITVNAILPHAATRMDAQAKGLAVIPGVADDHDNLDSPRHVGDFAAWLVSRRAAHLSGQVFEVSGRAIRLWRPWSVAAELPGTAPWTPDTLDEEIATHIYRTRPPGRRVPRRS
jgi:NAD(P)-dependent dehydrogenase (short-subunit alcohol dehydrogenase family)